MPKMPQNAIDAVNQYDFKKELAQLINKYSRENGSNTPDWILAEYLVHCLNAWNSSVNARERWYGRHGDSISTVGAD
jgi:hypothetical protein